MFKLIYNGENEKLVHKNVFSETLAELAKEDKNLIYLDADLTNSAGTYKFWQENPNQAFNCGIAEANMMGVAAGLALMGKKPYVHTLALLLQDVVLTKFSSPKAMPVILFVFSVLIQGYKLHLMGQRTCLLKIWHSYVLSQIL